jgi:hypothetical protein
MGAKGNESPMCSRLFAVLLGSEVNRRDGTTGIDDNAAELIHTFTTQGL